MTQASMLPAFGLPEPEYDPDQFYTPPDWFEQWHKEFDFTLDPCATAESAKCPRFFHAGQDGLAQSWAKERVYCNPPYSDIGPWVEKAHREVGSGCELVVMLLPATRSEQPWWVRFIEPYRDNSPARPIFSTPSPDLGPLRMKLAEASSIEGHWQCWEWQGHRIRGGYGRARWNGRMHLAHRLSYEAYVGPIAPGLRVLHRCDNRPCINPEHLFLGTDLENARDRDGKRRQARGELVRRSTLRTSDVEAIRAVAALGVTQKELALTYRVHNATISRILNGKRWAPSQATGPEPWLSTRFIKGRIVFGYPGNPDAKGVKGTGTFPSVLVIWKPTVLRGTNP